MIFDLFSGNRSIGSRTVLVLVAFLIPMLFLSSGVSAEILPGDFSGNVYAPNGETLQDVNVTIRGYTDLGTY